jgi:ribose transport system permease protein
MKIDKQKIKDGLIQNNTYLILILLIFISSLLTPNFLTPMNIRNIYMQQTAPICIAIGMLFVILTGGIDLSVGSFMAFGVGMMGFMLVKQGINIAVTIPVTLAFGFVMGCITGLLVAYTNMQGFIASLAMMTIARGLAFILTGGFPIALLGNPIEKLASKDYNYPVFYIVASIIIIFILIQHYTTYGRLVIACGSNRKAVELAGVHVRRYITSVYALSGMLSVFAGMIVASRTAAASPNLGNGYELNAIAACAIGGASLAGGIGSVSKTIAGVFVLALINNVMNLMAVPPYPQDVIKGSIIIIAVLLQLFTNRTDQTV